MAAGERPNSPETLIGRSTKEVILEIFAANPRIKQIAFVRYAPGNNDELDLFWKWPDLGAAPTKEGLRDMLDWLTAPERDARNTEIGVISLVEVEREKDPAVYMDLRHDYCHIPMLDFQFTGVGIEDADAVRRIKGRLRDLGLTGDRGGWVLKSRQGSYHFYGKELLDQKDWYALMVDSMNDTAGGFAQQALLPKIKRLDYSARQYATLRIASSLRSPETPTVIDII